MTTKHIHHDVIIEWAKGATIQYYDIDFHGWRDVCENWPSFDPSILFRVKPEPVTKWYRVALFKTGNGVTFVLISENDYLENHYENSSTFVRWVTDRQYVEV